jgi:hypothetical protein
MLREITTKAGEKMRVEAILKSSTHADGILPLAKERPQGTHQLLVVCLDQAQLDVAIAVCVLLVDVVQHCVGLVAIARAQLEKQRLAN